MDTQLLRTLLVVARTGGFTAAAAELHVVQSTVTSHVKALEHQFGVRLVDRLPGGSRLTEVGRRVAEHARDVLDAEQRMFDAARADSVAGDVVVGATESVCAYRLPRLVAELAAEQPGVRVHLTPVGTAAGMAGLRDADGRLDVVLVLEDTVPGQHPGRIIGAEPLVVVAAPGHPAASGPLGWPDLARYPHFVLEEGCSYTDRYVAELRARGAALITRFGSIEAARACVAAGLGLSLLPRVAVAAQLADGTLGRVDAPHQPDVPLILLTNPRRSPAAATRAAITKITAAAADGWRTTPAKSPGVARTGALP